MKIRSLNLQTILNNTSKNHYLKLIKNHVRSLSQKLHSQQHAKPSEQFNNNNRIVHAFQSKKYNLRHIFQQNVLQSQKETYHNMIIKNHQFVPLNINKFNPANLYIRKNNHLIYRKGRQQGRNFAVGKVILTERAHRSQSGIRHRNSRQKIAHSSQFCDHLQKQLKQRCNNVQVKNDVKPKIIKQCDTKIRKEKMRVEQESNDKQNLKDRIYKTDNSSKIKWHKSKVQNNFINIISS